MDVTVCVATFGTAEWVDLAQERAIPSAQRQGVPVIHRHADTLAEARNDAIAAATTSWVICLDADDQLGDGYVTALSKGHADIRVPSLIEVHLDGSSLEVDLTQRNIERLNPIPISAMVRREMVLSAGGFQPWPAWEDWALWLTLVRRGATYEHIPDARLYAHVSPRSRNRSISDPAGLHAAIRKDSR